MKRIRVYWRNQPDDLKVLDVVGHIRFGPDDEELVTTDSALPTMHALVREFPEQFWMEDVQDVDPPAAAELVCKLASAASSPGLLRQLVQLVSTESVEAADRLKAQYRDRLEST
ncbi:MAG: hypothetical protein EXR47_00210 [Dehalococcoidia bacterium]|nr:hypothetical protein [Dehalococcoidia bacterium]